MQSIFNTLLRNDPNFVNVKDKDNILKSILIIKPPNYEIKIKFGKYLLMEDKTFFYKAQRNFYILQKFIQKCKLKKTMILDIDYDLRLNPFDPKTQIFLKENKQIYPFNIYDLLNIIESSLLKQTNLFAIPHYPKNPYTNIEFKPHNLYNIYIFCLERKIKIPYVYILFFNCDFCIIRLLDKHRVQLSEWAIDSYLHVDTLITDNIVEDMYDMFSIYNIFVHRDFPIKKLFCIFRPYLKYYYNSNTKTEIERFLDCFNLYNPYFGQKYSLPDGTSSFDDRHLSFQQIKNGSISMVWNTKLFNKMNGVKFQYENQFCISLEPIENANYYEESTDTMDEEFEDDSDNSEGSYS